MRKHYEHMVGVKFPLSEVHQQPGAHYKGRMKRIIDRWLKQDDYYSVVTIDGKPYTTVEELQGVCLIMGLC